MTGRFDTHVLGPFDPQLVVGLLLQLPELPLLITMPCGETMTLTEWPDEDVHCTCNNPNHWFVKYRSIGGE